MTRKHHVGILTSIFTAAISPVYADIHLPPSAYLPRQTISLQAGHGWQESFDTFFPIGEDSRHLFFLDGSAAVANVYRGGDVGVGYRQLLANNRVIYGAYAFLGRYKTNYDHFFSQTNLGVERLGSEWDARINAYLPVGTKQQSESQLDPSSIYFQAHKLRGNQLVNNEIIESGAEIEVGRLIPGLSYGDSTLRAYVSYYHYGFNADAEKINGGSVRAEYRYNHYMTFTASESYDKVQGNELVFGINFSNGTPAIEDPSSIEYRMTEYVTRRRIVTSRDQFSQPFISPENFYFVNNGAAPGGNGTYELPYNTVQPAESDAANDGNRHTNYVYIYNGTGASYNLGGQLTLGRNRVFVGSGTDLIYRGVNVLSASGTPTLIGGLNLSSNNFLSSFNLDGTGTGLNTGINGNNVYNITIQNINISNYTGNDGANGTDGQDGDDGIPGGAPPTDGTSGTNGTAGESAYGIHLTNVSNIIIRNVNITNLTGGLAGRGGFGGDGGDGGGNNSSNGGNGGNGADGGNGGNAIGIGIENASGVLINNVNITNLTGGDGRIGGFGGEGGDATGGPDLPNGGGNGGNAGAGGEAGSAIGIQLLGTPNAVINTATISGLTAGIAGDGNDGGNGGDAGGDVPVPNPARDGGNGGNGGNGGSGGDAIGIQQNGAAVSATNINVSTLTSSTGGSGGIGGTGGDPIQGGNPGTPGTTGTTGSTGTAANTTP